MYHLSIMGGSFLGGGQFSYGGGGGSFFGGRGAVFLGGGGQFSGGQISGGTFPGGGALFLEPTMRQHCCIDTYCEYFYLI